jgi:hypothetical protein
LIVKTPGTVEDRAAWLLWRMRQSPMRRGSMSKSAHQLRRGLFGVMIRQGVPAALARRMSFQFAIKFDRADLHDEPAWSEIARIVRGEVERLRHEVRMSEQRIVAALPKLSAEQIVEFFHELSQADRRIARTILHAALNTAEPLTVGRRYLAEYQLVVRKLSALDPSMARTVAAASFSASAPLNKAMEHLERFAALMTKYQDTPEIARRLARATFRAKIESDEPDGHRPADLSGRLPGGLT